jgi:hypothetical protein
MLHNPYCSPSTSRATKTSGVNYIPPGLVTREWGRVYIPLLFEALVLEIRLTIPPALKKIEGIE